MRTEQKRFQDEGTLELAGEEEQMVTPCATDTFQACSEVSCQRTGQAGDTAQYVFQRRVC